MSILFDEENRLFYIHTAGTSYCMQISAAGYLCHAYWGARIRELHPSDAIEKRMRALSPNTDPNDLDFSLDTAPLEYPAYGSSDFRTPAFEVQFADGSTVCCPKVKSHRMIKGKPPLAGLPATYCEDESEAETLEITLEDTVGGLEITLCYTAFPGYDAIVRSARLKNTGKNEIRIMRALSMSADIRCGGFELLQLSGAWARERQIVRRPLVPGMQSVESRRGASSAQQNPFLALLSPHSGEEHGEVYGVSLVYSGSFLAGAEVDQFDRVRVFIGVNPFDFSWLLQPGENFQCPETVLVYSGAGLGKMSRTFHRFYRERLCRGAYRDRERPVVLNNWEATHFSFDAHTIETLAAAAGELGAELFVLDDGWFGERNDESSSLGDWFVNRRKLPDGLNKLAAQVNASGTAFGLWVEPEMVSRDSALYRAHPDWCLHVEGRDRTESRRQLVLDLCRSEVRGEIERMLTELLQSANIRYVKWDMNRNITEAGSTALAPECQREVSHRYMLGLYELLDRLTRKFPQVLFEGCAAGGGRFDPGILCYMPQIWTSDNTDAAERLKIQYGTSIVYPPCAMTAHVSEVPNQQTNRSVPLETRAYAAMMANFGLELDPLRLSGEEREAVKRMVADCKSIRRLVQFGDLFRLKSPFEGNDAAFLYASPDRLEAVAAYFRLLATANAPEVFLRFAGLNPDARYEETVNGGAYYGDELLHSGLPVRLYGGDFQCRFWHFRAAR